MNLPRKDRTARSRRGDEADKAGPHREITATIPASTSNLGPGFDALGIALNLYNQVRVAPASPLGFRIVSPISEADRSGAEQMLGEAADLFFATARRKPFGLQISLSGDVPIARGLGSSVTVRLGLVACLNALTKGPLSSSQTLDLVTALEHHPDNAAPALYGGFAVSGMLGSSVRCVRFRLPPSLKFVALIPDFEVSTEQARKLVPQQFSKADAIHNLNRAALISAAFARAEYDALRGLFEDKIHQPYRQQLIPPLFDVIRAGEKAGAVGGWLSGSGSTIICLTMKNPEAVGRAMKRALPNSEIKILTADNRGCKISG